MSIEVVAQDRLKYLLISNEMGAHHRVKSPLTITEMRTRDKTQWGPR
jgi:hypothetical protein